MNERVNATGAAHSAAPASYNSRRWRITTWNCPSQKDASETPGLTGGQGEIRERRQTGPHESRHDSFGFGFGLFVGLTETGKVSTGLTTPRRATRVFPGVGVKPGFTPGPDLGYTWDLAANQEKPRDRTRVCTWVGVYSACGCGQCRTWGCGPGQILGTYFGTWEPGWAIPEKDWERPLSNDFDHGAQR